MADGRVVIEVELDDKGVVKGVKGLEKAMGGVSGAAEKATVSIGKIASALGLVKVASKVFELIRNSMDKAFTRIDTMEQFERVMTTMTGSTEEANAALETTNGIVKGTAYGLDVAAKSVQNFVTRGLDVDKATDSVESWGDAVAFYGDGSNETFSSVTSALSQMVTKGNVDMEQMNRIFDAGIPALDIYADAVGMSTDEVSEQISKGELKAEDFIDVMNRAFSEGTDGFSSISGAAKEAGASWGASFDNMAAAVARGVTSIIQETDRLLAENGLPTMRDMIAEFGSAMESALNAIADAIPKVVDLVKEMYDGLVVLHGIVEPLTPALLGLAAAFATFYIITHFVGWMESAYLAVLIFGDSMVGVGKTIGKLFGLLTKHPIALLVSAIIGLVVALVYLWKTNEDFRNAVQNIWTSITTFVQESIEAIKGWLSDFGSYLGTLGGKFQGLTDQIGGFFSSIGSAVGSFVSIVQSGIGIVIAYFAGLSFSLDPVREAFENLKTSAQELWETFQNSAVFSFLINAFDMVVQRVMDFKDAIMAVIRDFDFAPLMEQVALFFPKLIALFISQKLGMVLMGAQLIENIAAGMGMTVPELIETATNALVSMIEQFSEALPQYVESGTNFIVSLIEGITAAIPMVTEAAINILFAIIETLLNSIVMLTEVGVSLLTGLIEGIVSVLPVLVETAVFLITALLTVFLGMLPTLLTVGVQLLLSLLEGILSVLPVLLESAALIIIELVGTFLELLPQLIEVGVELLLNLIEGLISMLPSLIEAGITLLTSLVDAFISMIPALIEAGITLVTSLIEGLIAALPQLIDAGIQLVISLGDALISMLPTIIDAGGQILNALVGGILQLIPALISAGIQLIVALGAAILQMIPLILSAGGQILMALVQGILSLIGQLLSAGVRLVTQLISTILSFLGRMLSAGGQLIRSLISGITGTISGVASAVSSGIQNALSKVTGFLGRFRQAGANIVGNIADGIRGAVGKVTGAISSVTQKIRDFLPFSPPKDKNSPLADIHKNGIGEQISKGIYDGENEVRMAMEHILQVPDVKRIMPELGHSVAIESVTQPAASQIYNNQNYHFNANANGTEKNDREFYERLYREFKWLIQQEGGSLDG